MPLDDSEEEDEEEEEEEGADMESDLEGETEDGRNEIICLHPTFGPLSQSVL